MIEPSDTAGLVPYLSQLEARAAELGLDLGDVCAAEGVADTTLARWKKRQAYCREGTARALFNRMEMMARERAA